MIIEVKNNLDKQLLSIKFNDEWERYEYFKNLESLFRVYEEEIESKNYNFINNSIIIELNENQVKLLKDDLEYFTFFVFSNLNYDIINNIQDRKTILKLTV